MRILSAALAACLAVPAAAECVERDVYVGFLATKGQRLHAWGLTSNGNMVELFLSDDGTWTVLQTTPGRCTSVISTVDHEGGRLWAPHLRPLDRLQRPPLREGDPA